MRPALDSISRNSMLLNRPETTVFVAPDYPTGDSYEESTDISPAPEEMLWLALCTASDEGLGIEELMRETGMARATLYRHLRELAQRGYAYQVSRGHWRARTTEEPTP
jgi:biotin operon repressor